MNKYRKVLKPKDAVVKDDDEIRVTAAGSVSAYVSRAAKVFNELEKAQVTVTATGNALTKAVTLAEIIKRRFKGLHQITNLGSQEIIDEYEPLEEGLDKVTDTRSISFIEIKLSKEALDTSDKGYQPPIDESLVTDFDPDKLAMSRGRGGRGGKGKGKGRGKGKGKDDGDRDQYRDQSSGKGKGKFKGKDSDESKGKGKGKKGDKGFEKGEKGKGKGKGEKGDKGKGKGKLPRLEDNWDYERSFGKGKGKGKGKKGEKGFDKGSWGGWGGDSYGKNGGGKSKGGGKNKQWENSWDDDWSYGQSYDYGKSGKGKSGKGGKRGGGQWY